MAVYRNKPKLSKNLQSKVKTLLARSQKKEDYLTKVSKSERYLGQVTEIKMADGNPTYTPVGDLASTTSPNILNLIAQGDDINQRVGRRIALHSVTLKGWISNTNPNQCSARVVLAYDKQTNSASPALSYFQGGTAFNALSNFNNQGRFITLMDQKYDFDGTGGRQIHEVNFFKFLKGIPTHYSGSSGAIGSVDSGALVMWVFATTATGVTADIYTRCKYKDN